MHRGLEGHRRFAEEGDFTLKQRHLEVLQLFVSGLASNREVAKALRGVSPSTVEQYRKEILAELRRNEISPATINRGITEAVVRGLINVDFLPSAPREPLNQREIEVLALETEGYGPGYICRQLDINNNHVLNTLKRDIVKKLGLATIYQAVSWSAREMARAAVVSNPHA